MSKLVTITLTHVLEVPDNWGRDEVTALINKNKGNWWDGKEVSWVSFDAHLTTTEELDVD